MAKVLPCTPGVDVAERNVEEIVKLDGRSHRGG
jgi:hypothetical protein